MTHPFQERSWMYNQRESGHSYNNAAFMAGVREFIRIAISRGQTFSGDKLRCPCSKCRNRKYPDITTVEEHLYTYGFVQNYYNWTLHGEDIFEAVTQVDEGTTSTFTPEQECEAGVTAHNVDSHFEDMVVDVAGPNFPVSHSTVNLSDVPTAAAGKFYNLFNSSSLPAYEGCTTETELSIHMKLLHAKSNHGLSEPAYDSICGTMRNLVGVESRIPISYQHSKKFVNDLGMGYVRIDVCVSGCMIFYAEDEGLESCRFCGEARYKPPRRGDNTKRYKRKAYKSMFYLPIIPRLQRLFLTEATASHMSWHATRRDDSGKMVHPSDGQSWKYFDQCYPSFATEARNVRLGLSSDGFSPFDMSSKN